MAKKSYTAKQLQVAFAVGHMTIYNWRQGTATRDPLPCETDDETGRVTFPAASTKAWAKKYGLTFTEPTDSGEASKPGPKATTPVKKATPAKTTKKLEALRKGSPKAPRKIDPNTTEAIKQAAQRAIGVTKTVMTKGSGKFEGMNVVKAKPAKKPALSVVPAPAVAQAAQA